MNDVAHAGRIGPNAVIRLAEALEAVESRAVTVRLFDAAGFGAHALAPPDAMVPEGEVTALHRQLPERAWPEAGRKRVMARGTPHGRLPAGESHPEAQRRSF